MLVEKMILEELGDTEVKVGEEVEVAEGGEPDD